MALDENNIYSGVELELPPYINYDPAAPAFRPSTGTYMNRVGQTFDHIIYADCKILILYVHKNDLYEKFKNTILVHLH